MKGLMPRTVATSNCAPGRRFEDLCDRVPGCLVQRPQWVAWKYVERDGKETKAPVNPHTGGPRGFHRPYNVGGVS